jgi:Ca2+-binding EF-hand superfamily protein
LVKFFDSDEDGRLAFQDFIQMLLPCEENNLRNVALDRPSHRVGRHDGLPQDIERGIAEIFDRELDLMRRQDILKRDCFSRYDFNLHAAFKSVDRYNDGRIDSNVLGNFFRNCGHFATEREILQILRRIDTDGDARLSFKEFSEFMTLDGTP